MRSRTPKAIQPHTLRGFGRFGRFLSLPPAQCESLTFPMPYGSHYLVQKFFTKSIKLMAKNLSYWHPLVLHQKK